MIKILLIGDQPSVRKGLQMQLALESDLAIVGEAGDNTTAFELLEAQRPDVIVMDVDMPGMDGVKATEALHMRQPDIPVILLSFYTDPISRARAMSAGAAAFVEKRGGAAALLSAIRQSVGQ